MKSRVIPITSRFSNLGLHAGAEAFGQVRAQLNLVGALEPFHACAGMTTGESL